MTICAKKRQVFRLGAVSWPQVAHRDDMVALDIPVASHSVFEREVKIAYFAGKSPVLFQRFPLFSSGELAAPLPDAVHPGKDAALRSFCEVGDVQFSVGWREVPEVRPDCGSST